MTLPLIETPEQAARLAEEHHDTFYIDAFRLQLWLGGVSVRAIAEYAENPPDRRSMQTGQAWSTFLTLFGVTDEECFSLVQTLVRFSGCENPLSLRLSAALAPIYLEHAFYGDYLGPRAPNYSDDPAKAARLIRHSLLRLCDWVDADIHLQTHSLWHLAPACFDPDPDKRYLAARDLSQPYIAQMNDPGLVQPCTHLSRRSPLPSIPERPWAFRRLDECVIALWPFVRLHKWSFSVLASVLRKAAVQPAAAPLKSTDALENYCATTLGLHHPGADPTINAAAPPGLALALLFCRSLRSSPSPSPGHAPWS